MNPRTARLIVWSGGTSIAAAAVLAVVLNLVYGDAVFAARLVAGLTGCL